MHSPTTVNKVNGHLQQQMTAGQLSMSTSPDGKYHQSTSMHFAIFTLQKTQRSTHLISARTSERQATVLLIFLKEELTSPSTDHSSASIISPAVWHQLAFVPLPALEEPYLGARRDFMLHVESLILSLLEVLIRALVTVSIYL